MLKRTFITSGLLLCLTLEIHGSAPKPAFPKQWKANFTFAPSVVKVNDHLLVVDLRNNTVIVNSTFDGNHQSNVCKLNFFNADKSTSGSHIKITALGNGKIVIETEIISLFKARKYEPSSSRLLLILDPFDCSTLRKVELGNDQYSKFIGLVPYHDSFDLFQYKLIENNESLLKMPQRYNDQGEQLKLDHFIVFEKGVEGIAKIEAIEPYDASKGYVSQIYTNGKFVLRLLNSRFEKVEEVAVDVNDYINNWSVSQGKISYCHSVTKKINGQFREKINACWLLDAGLKSKVLVDLVHPDDVESSFRNRIVSIANLPDGGALVLIAYDMTFEDPTANYKHKLYVYHINADGSVRKPVDISLRNPSLYRRENPYGIPLGDGEFCFVSRGYIIASRNESDDRNWYIWIDCDQVSNL